MLPFLLATVPIARAFSQTATHAAQIAQDLAWTHRDRTTHAYLLCDSSVLNGDGFVDVELDLNAIRLGQRPKD